MVYMYVDSISTELGIAVFLFDYEPVVLKFSSIIFNGYQTDTGAIQLQKSQTSNPVEYGWMVQIVLRELPV